MRFSKHSVGSILNTSISREYFPPYLDLACLSMGPPGAQMPSEHKDVKFKKKFYMGIKLF